MFLCCVKLGAFTSSHYPYSMKTLTKPKDTFHKLWWLLLLAVALLACLAIWWYFDYKIEQLKQTPTSFQTSKNNVL